MSTTPTAVVMAAAMIVVANMAVVQYYSTLYFSIIYYCIEYCIMITVYYRVYVICRSSAEDPVEEHSGDLLPATAGLLHQRDLPYPVPWAQQFHSEVFLVNIIIAGANDWSCVSCSSIRDRTLIFGSLGSPASSLVPPQWMSIGFYRSSHSSDSVSRLRYLSGCCLPGTTNRQ